MFRNIFRKIFRKMNQGSEGLWLGTKGPTDKVEGCNLLQEIDKASFLVMQYSYAVFYKGVLNFLLLF